ncbi:MAG: iron-sulfur cluster repair di-iron protein [Verrucomicrobiota bacterium]|jgi:regulator of cell morphogenesis and NO signaling|nr:iron-sulfur cluster repair di-iron protein [Verrucomicrobiota bacterium]MDP6250651.1 iron-sulfur cluster repair di-iron protein [Verrucomicrobiota bacterium]MDP7177886.1 iron-sulfur cluster repair di-iron protein [Verrucomicrobiota bacterium]MDP7291474.1 iron-sulfur cluster repair di-iron protein [Verrucomicrobiota bacterium]MDP7440346.1 iron-sulfur cluster repair di-iron protein [Verrucomicrobiota bacterium]|tara:strand:+ start:187 stop:897 length:711 start_codon:yes stop_codon:yes gene_type:complete
MNEPQLDSTVGDIVAGCPALASVFENIGIDYCCGGKKTLGDACRDKGLEPQSVLATLAQPPQTEPVADTAVMALTELADHIEQTHHAYLRSEFSRLNELTSKVASVHGDQNPRLHQVSETCRALIAELSDHMMKEEQILFPLVRQLDASDTAPTFHCGSLANPIHQMESEHSQAGAALERLRELTDGFTPPDGACNSYRAMLNAIAHLERDLHLHIHKENNVLFPRALEMEQNKRS